MTSGNNVADVTQVTDVTDVTDVASVIDVIDVTIPNKRTTEQGRSLVFGLVRSFAYSDNSSKL